MCTIALQKRLTAPKAVTVLVALLGLFLASGCSGDDASADAASGDSAGHFADIVEVLATDATKESQQGGGGTLADAMDGADELADIGQADGLAESHEAAEVGADATDVNDLGSETALCGIQVRFLVEDYELQTFGDIEIVVDVSGALAVELRYRVALEEQPLSSVPMTPESLDEPGGFVRWRATIPAEVQTIAGLDYMVVAQNDECSVFEPQADAAYEAPGMLYHIALYGELPLAVDPFAYLYAPSVHDGRVTASPLPPSRSLTSPHSALRNLTSPHSAPQPHIPELRQTLRSCFPRSATPLVSQLTPHEYFRTFGENPL